MCSSWYGCRVGWTGPLSGMNPKDLIGCVVPPRCTHLQAAEVPRYPGTLIPDQTLAMPISLRPHRVLCPCSAVQSSAIPCSFVRSFVRSTRRHPPSHSINLHNAQRSIPPSRRLGQPHCTGPHCMTLIQHYITLHYTLTTPHRLAFFLCLSQCLSVCLVSAVVSPNSARLCLPSVP